MVVYPPPPVASPFEWIRIAPFVQNSLQSSQPVHTASLSRGTWDDDSRAPVGQTATQPKHPSHDSESSIRKRRTLSMIRAWSGVARRRAAVSRRHLCGILFEE